MGPLEHSSLRTKIMSTGLVLVFGLGCDASSSKGDAKGDTKADASALEAKGEAKAPAGANAEAPAAPAGCQASITVTGDETFTAELSPSLSTVDRKEEPWISMQANRLTDPAHPFTLAFFAPAAASGELPFYDEARAMNLLNLTMIGGADYSAFATHNKGASPGTFVMTKPREGWIEVHGKAKLSDGEGKQIEVQFDLVRALSSAKCK